MSETKELLKKLAIQIRDERKIGANTAQRVGSFLLSLVESGADIEELAMYFLRKDQPDETRFLINFLAGATFGNFNEGPLGTGACVKIDPATGKSYIEVDELFVRMKAYFQKLVIEKLAHVGGNVILSPARMQCIKVEEHPDFYRCFFLATDGEKTIDNEFAIDDQATIREFNVKPGAHQNVSNRYYWRLVTAVGEDYIDLSKTICDAGSDVPLAGDDICQLGNQSDKSRQNAIILSSFGSGSPCIQHYKGINSFSLTGKKVTEIGEDSIFSGKVVIGKGSTGFENFDDKPDIDAINKAILDTLGIAEEAINTANDNQQAVAELGGYVDGAFADGIIQESEAKAIGTYINTVNNGRAAVEATYNKLFRNAYLEGTPKAELLNAKITLFESIDKLIVSINTAISDGKTTSEEKRDVDTKFAIYNSSYAGFNTAVEAANKAIQDKLKGFADEAQNTADKAQTNIDNISTEVKNTVAQNLGYSNFAALKAAAEKGKTIIKGGKINTELIEATAIITAQVIADAIAAASLNINNRFFIAKDGTFKGTGGELKDMVLTGAYRSPFKDGLFSWGNSHIAIPGVQDNNNVIISNESRAYLACALPCSMDYDGFCATILNEDYKGKRTEGPLSFSVEPGYGIYEDGVKQIALTVKVRTGVDIQGFSDGTAFRGWIVKRRFKSSTDTVPIYGDVVVYASPKAGGTVIGGGDKIAGTTGILTAIPNEGYEFSRWQDGVMTPSRAVTWNESSQSFTAYFVVAETYYTITVVASPLVGGIVNGGGRKIAGSTGEIEAVANAGYAFSHWEDGSKNINRVVSWDSDKTYTAYFVEYIPAVDELLTNVNFSDTTSIVELTTDMVGETRLTVFNKILLWNVLSGATGTTRGITFNRGYLSGKLFAGKNYRFTCQVHSVSNPGKNFLVLIGRPLVEPFTGDMNQIFDAIGSGSTVGIYAFADDYINISMDFTALHASTADDCIIFISDAMTGVINIKNPSLKEI